MNEAIERRLFVAGTDTEVGKTRIATAICMAFASAGCAVAAMKPVASGCFRSEDGLRNLDALALKAAMTVSAPYEDINPYAFEPAVSPHIAAREAGCVIDLTHLDRCYERLSIKSDVTVVEGVGGWLAPLDDERTLADLAVRWQLDVLLVVGLRLGCLSHALLTAESIERRGLKLRGWIANSIDPHFERREENLSALRLRLPAPCLSVFPYAPASDAFANSKRLGDTILNW